MSIACLTREEFLLGDIISILNSGFGQLRGPVEASLTFLFLPKTLLDLKVQGSDKNLVELVIGYTIIGYS
jgi:hypothetical protein